MIHQHFKIKRRLWLRLNIGNGKLSFGQTYLHYLRKFPLVNLRTKNKISVRRINVITVLPVRRYTRVRHLSFATACISFSPCFITHQSGNNTNVRINFGRYDNKGQQNSSFMITVNLIYCHLKMLGDGPLSA